MKETGRIIMLIICLLVVSVLIWWLIYGKGPVGSSGNWSNDQIEQAKDSIGDAVPMSNKNCIIEEYSSKYSYTDFQDQKDFDTVFPNILNKCLGSKGNWDKDFKQSLINLMSKNNNTNCSKCIIDKIEMYYSPLDYLIVLEKVSGGNIDDPDVKKYNKNLSEILATCKHMCDQ